MKRTPRSWLPLCRAAIPILYVTCTGGNAAGAVDGRDAVRLRGRVVHEVAGKRPLPCILELSAT